MNILDDSMGPKSNVSCVLIRGRKKKTDQEEKADEFQAEWSWQGQQGPHGFGGVQPWVQTSSLNCERVTVVFSHQQLCTTGWETRDGV